MYNKELQVIDTQEKAYILGLFYSDGSVGGTKYQSRITLKYSDKDLIFRLKELFPFFYIHSTQGRNTLELGNYNKQLQEDLISNGCLSRKSFENRGNIHLPNLETGLLPHFIRGYYDGNGGCTLSHQKQTGKKTQKRVYIYSVSKNLLEEIKESLNTINIRSYLTSTVGKNMEVYKLSISTENYTDFYNYLYSDATLWLERKKIGLEEIINTTNFFKQKSSVPCKFCGSDNVVCDGWIYYKVKRQRYLCKSCKKHFSAPLSSNI